MPKKKGSTKVLVEARLEEVVSLLDSSVPVHNAVATLAKKWDLTPKQVRNYVRKLDERRAIERQRDAPFLRERRLREIERLKAKCIAERKYGPAVAAATLQARLEQATEWRDPEVEALILANGAPPRDPAQAHTWLQRSMLITLYAIQRNPSIDALLKLRLIADYGAKGTLMGDKAIIQEDLRLLKAADRKDRGRDDAPVDPPAARPTEA